MAPTFLNYFGFGSSEEIKKNEAQTAVRALPSSWYTSQEMYELERRAIFSRKWLLMTHQLRLKEPGDFLRYEVAGYNIMLIRDRQGTINAFHNVCRHRAFPVVEENKGTLKILACKYHGWSYGLNGKLAKAPGYQDLEGFDKSQNGLFPIHVHIDINGFVWVNLDSKETPEVAWEDDLDGVDEQEKLKEFMFDEDYEFDHTWEMDGGYNWKILADNFNECYHCATTHPDVPSLANLESYDVDPKAGAIRHNAATTEEQKAAGLRIASTYYFPNSSMTVSPHFFFIQKFIPNGPTSSSMRYEVYRNKNSSEEDFQLINQMYKRIMSEDKALCDLAQKNLNAGVFINGEMHPHMEKGPLYFQKVVRETVTEHHKREKTARQEIWPARQNLPGNASISQEDVEFCKGLACSNDNDALAIPFSIRTADDETLYAWHILPIELYRKHEQALLVEPSGFLQDITSAFAFQLLRDDPDARLVIHMHGAGGTVASGYRVPNYRALSAGQPDKIHVLTFDYRGFGRSSGHPSEHGIPLDAQTVVGWATQVAHVPPRQVVIFGQSIHGNGSEPRWAVLVASFVDVPTLASTYRVAGSIPIISPLARFPALFNSLRAFIRDEWPSKDRVAKYVGANEFNREKCQLTLIHAEDDYDIPFDHTPALFKHAVNAAVLGGITDEAYDDWKEKKQNKSR